MFEIRNAYASDLKELGQFYHDMWHESQAPFQDPGIAEFRDQKFMQARIDAFFPNIILAKKDNLAGLVVASEARLSQLFVDPNIRGHGLGTKLLELAEAKLIAEGTTKATLSCIEGNVGARRFYERHGWRVSKSHTKLGETRKGWVAKVHIWEMEKVLVRLSLDRFAQQSE